MNVAGGNFPIHRLLFKKDFGRLVAFFKQGYFGEADLN
jgi:hypothetical protein